MANVSWLMYWRQPAQLICVLLLPAMTKAVIGNRVVFCKFELTEDWVGWPSGRVLPASQRLRVRSYDIRRHTISPCPG